MDGLCTRGAAVAHRTLTTVLARTGRPAVHGFQSGKAIPRPRRDGRAEHRTLSGGISDIRGE